MARTGRPPKPTEQKRLNGNPGKRSLPAPAVTIPNLPAIPRPPDDLSERGAAYWDQVWTTAQAWLNPVLDGPVVGIVCRTYDEIVNLRSAIAEHGQLLEEPITTPSGVVVGTRLVPNPAAKMLRDAEKQLQSWLSDLGFTPSARARLGFIEVKKQSILEGLMSRRESDAIDADIIDIWPDN